MTHIEVKRMICYARKLWHTPPEGLDFCKTMTVLADTKNGDDCNDAIARLATARLASFGKTTCDKCHEVEHVKKNMVEHRTSVNTTPPAKENSYPMLNNEEKPLRNEQNGESMRPEKNEVYGRMRSRASLVNEKDRELTFVGSWADDWPVTPQVLAKSGFFYRGPEDVVECVWCTGTLMGWQTGDNPFHEHATHYPKCPKFGMNALNATPIERSCQSSHCQYHITGLLKHKDAIDHVIKMEYKIHEEEQRLVNANQLQENLERRLGEKVKEMECFYKEKGVDQTKIVRTKQMVDNGCMLTAGAPQNMNGGWSWVKVLNDTAPGSNTWKEVIRLNQAYCDFRDAHKHLGPENVFMIEARIPGFLDYINEMEEHLRQDAHEINGIKEMINLHRKNQQQFCEHYNTYLAKCCMKEKQGQ